MDVFVESEIATAALQPRNDAFCLPAGVRTAGESELVNSHHEEARGVGVMISM